MTMYVLYVVHILISLKKTNVCLQYTLYKIYIYTYLIFLFYFVFHLVSGVVVDENGPYDFDREALRSAVKNKVLELHDVSRESEHELPKHIAEKVYPGLNGRTYDEWIKFTTSYETFKPTSDSTDDTYHFKIKM